MRVMYKSPIELIVSEWYKQLVEQQNNDIYKAVINTGVVVDKDELLKALQYDRSQYDKGFQDAMDSIVHCKDCKHKVVTIDGEYNPKDIVCDYHMSDGFSERDFCSYGERKGEGE